MPLGRPKGSKNKSRPKDEFGEDVDGWRKPKFQPPPAIKLDPHSLQGALTRVGNPNANYIVESDIPIPTARCRSSKFPFQDMKVGDSFEVPNMTRPYQGLYDLAKRYGIKIKCFKQPNGFYRVWRIKDPNEE